MAETIKLVQSDDLPGITFTIRDAHKAAAGQELDKKDSDSWAPVNLTGCTVSALVSELDSTVSIESLPCFIARPIEGEVLVTIGEAVFLDKAGLYQIEVTVAFAEGRQTVYDMLKLDVRERVQNVS